VGVVKDRFCSACGKYDSAGFYKLFLKEEESYFFKSRR
jgi:hypothetical protein